jgi:hypothetical protein
MTKGIEMWKGRPRFAYRDTLKGIYRCDRRTGKETYFWMGGGKKRKHR